MCIANECNHCLNNHTHLFLNPKPNPSDPRPPIQLHEKDLGFRSLTFAVVRHWTQKPQGQAPPAPSLRPGSTLGRVSMGSHWCLGSICRRYMHEGEERGPWR